MAPGAMGRILKAAGRAAPADAGAGRDPLEAARAEARRLLEAAAGEAERIRAAAAEEGRRQGWSEAGEALVAAEAERRRAIEALEADVLRLALGVAGKVVGSLAAQEGLAVETARRALARLRRAPEVELRAHPADAPALRSALPGPGPGASGAGRVLVREDAEVGRGGVVAESAAARVDARLEAQLEEIGRALGAAE
jgi:flagellar biosynthesis/type III secretory pathway protein FliH